MIDRRLFSGIDWMLVGLVLLISLIGVLNIYSATTPYKISGTPYYIKQLNLIMLGMLVGLTICSFDYHILEDLSYWLYGFIVLLLLKLKLVLLYK